MEGEKVIESLDCLWFFSSVMHAPKVEPIEVHSIKEEPEVENVEKVKTATEPIEIIETKRDVSSVHEVVKCGKNGGSRSRDEKENSEERKVRKASKKRNKKDVNVGDYEEQLGFDFRFDLSEICMMLDGYERFNKKRYGKMMPPLSDGMAMKQHLKSWAYAVACNVR